MAITKAFSKLYVRLTNLNKKSVHKILAFSKNIEYNASTNFLLPISIFS